MFGKKFEKVVTYCIQRRPFDTVAVATIIILVVLSLLLGGCSATGVPPAQLQGSVFAVREGYTLWSMVQALNGVPGYSIYTNAAKDAYFFSWTYATEGGSAWGMTLIRSAKSAYLYQDIVEWWKATRGQGIALSGSDGRDVHTFLVQQGWQKITPRDVPAVLAYGIKQAWTLFKVQGTQYVETLAAVMSKASTSLISIVVMPVVITADGPVAPDFDGSPFENLGTVY